MILLIEYDRSKGLIVNEYRFSDSDRIQAEKQRLQIELNLNRQKIDHEVVLLEAVDEKHLRHTHRRYFETLHSIAISTGTATPIITKTN